MYLETFYLPIYKEQEMIDRRMEFNGGKWPRGYIDNIYPCGIFSKIELEEVNFDRITILYGGNGSGKSTLLNLIANKLGLERNAPYNTSELFDDYTKACSIRYCEVGDGMVRKAPPRGSRIITSDDVFEYMLAVRDSNIEIANYSMQAREDWTELRYGPMIRFRGMEDYEQLRHQLLARKKSMTRRQFIKQAAGEEVKLNSNGETALKYFEMNLEPDRLYCLDEPENSLSPKMQLELVKMLESLARFFGCQFIIATHSPFVLSLPGARIYDLDETPVDIKPWWQLENAKIYYEFFEKHKRLFED